MFVFFGLVAVGGTAYVQVGRVDGATVLTGVAIGALACAILVANNLRDIAGDTAPASAPWPPGLATAGHSAPLRRTVRHWPRW